MDANNNLSSPTALFGIILFLGIVGFLFFLNSLPFPEDFGFWPLAGVFAVSMVAGFLIFALASGLIHAIYKAMIEFAVALLILGNVFYAAHSWAYFNHTLEYIEELELDIGLPAPIVAIAYLALRMFAIDVAAILGLLPLARTAQSDVLDPDSW